MMPFVLIGWLLAVPLAIWWPRPLDDESARTRAYRLLRNAATCLLPGYLLFTLQLGIDPNDQYFRILVLVFVFLGALSLTPLALGMLALDFQRRWLGLGSGVLAALFPAGIVVYALLTLIGAYMRLVPGWYAFPAIGALLLCGGATAFVLEAYAVMRAPRRVSGGE
ncbi:MAG TPA: hypothetical protein VHB98_13010 [Chloroflexota bacterium]|jgi:hypothetical protein|nr:hypothetical protein [Chloroflexota bacterium]